MKQYYWIISLDNLAGDDDLRELPSFRYYLEHAAYCFHVDSVYPSVTYPAHTTIVTGRFPAHHGIYNNTLFQPERLGREDWNWKSRRIKGRTLFDLAYEKGLTTAAYLWPVTGGNRKIRYNMPEVFANRPWDNQIITSLRNGSIRFQLEAFLHHGKEMDGIRQPALDQFLHHVVLDTFQKYRPEVQFIHYVDLDAMRHTYGHSSPEAGEALRRHDRRLKEIFDLVEQMGLMEQTHFVILGDHSSIDEHSAVYLNVLFRTAGLLQLKENGAVRNWQALSHTCDGSAYIHVRHPEEIPRVRALLEEFSAANAHCIEAVYSSEEAKNMGAGPCDLMVEASAGFYFLDEPEPEEVIHKIQPGDIGSLQHITRSTHGFSPLKKNYQTFFSMMGPEILPGEKAGPMSLTDIGPTIAHLLGGTLPDADGTIQTQFLRKETLRVSSEYVRH